MFGDFCLSLLGGGAPVTLIDSAATNSASPLSVPAHANGDILLFVNGASGAGAPATTSGFTSLLTEDRTGSGNRRSCNVQWRVSDGTISSLTYTNYGTVFVLRGGLSVRATSRGSTAAWSNSVALPSLTGCGTAGLSMLLCGTYAGTQGNSVGSPWALVSTRGANITNNTNATSPAANLGFNVSTIVDIAWVAEVLP